MRVILDATPVVRIDAPELFADPAFQDWLNEPSHKIATWYTYGTPDEMSDIFLTHYGGEGSDSETMPPHCWAQIVKAVQTLGGEFQENECLIWLTNVGSELGYDPEEEEHDE